ncbi:hypothetical protein COV77_04100 [Candidatus Pacearchaeota archaeon CG11_big_fil_rev_8_21_14_0_20_30_13]|nr:MAG: hypothetical protein COV77_04100 [Candidatus Pacearchaeota archaeon CG11_big_fil_rev_8_21_14_0_20_30_13]
MTQYLMRKERDSENLKNAIKNYEPLWFNVRPFSLGNAKTKVSEDLLGKKFNFLFLDGLKFSSDRDLICLPLKDYKFGFKTEYQNKNGSRIYPYYDDPNDPLLLEVSLTCLRNVIDDLLIEISFKGKIKLEMELYTNRRKYWKIE